MSDKYTMFKNFMHNELGITKDDIKKWTEDAIKQVAEKHVTNQINTVALNQKIINAAIKNPYNSELIRDIRTAVVNALADQLMIVIKEK